MVTQFEFKLQGIYPLLAVKTVNEICVREIPCSWLKLSYTHPSQVASLTNRKSEMKCTKLGGAYLHEKPVMLGKAVSAPYFLSLYKKYSQNAEVNLNTHHKYVT